MKMQKISQLICLFVFLVFVTTSCMAAIQMNQAETDDVLDHVIKKRAADGCENCHNANNNYNLYNYNNAFDHFNNFNVCLDCIHGCRHYYPNDCNNCIHNLIPNACIKCINNCVGKK